MRKEYENILNKENIRENLIALKQELKTENGKKQFQKLTDGCCDFIMKLLVEEDPKIRKNAASILGIVHCADAVDVLVDAYEAEETMFVRAEYLRALGELPCQEYLELFKKRLQELSQKGCEIEEKKHIQNEMRELQQLILSVEGVKKHTFQGWQRMNEVILTTIPAFRDLTAAQVTGSQTVKTGAGLRTKTCDLKQILKIRTFKELLFVIHGEKELPGDADGIAKWLYQSDLKQILKENHKEDGPYYFRLGVTGPMSLEERSRFSKKAAAQLEELFERQLINSASHYEIEIRLIQNKEGNFYPCLKLLTIPDTRFAYRRYHISAGMQPFAAAGILALAKNYLTEHGQVLDPFCGVGTMLIERNYLEPARDSYGLDIFGEAVEKARANTRIAGMNINYINRDFSDFRHEYLFDEIITDMPVKGSMSYERLEKLYEMFFTRASELVKKNGTIVMYSGEIGFVKKQIRLRNQFHLEREYCISEKNKTYVFIITYR